MGAEIHKIFLKYSNAYEAHADAAAQGSRQKAAGEGVELRVSSGNENAVPPARQVKRRGWFFRKISHLLGYVPSIKRQQNNLTKKSYQIFESDIATILSHREAGVDNPKINNLNSTIIKDIQEKKKHAKLFETRYANQVLQQVANSMSASGSGHALPPKARQAFVKSSGEAEESRPLSPDENQFFGNDFSPSPKWTLGKFRKDHSWETKLKPSFKESLGDEVQYTQSYFENNHPGILKEFDNPVIATPNISLENYLTENAGELQNLVDRFVLLETSNQLLKNPDRKQFMKFYQALPEKVNNMLKTEFQAQQLDYLAKMNERSPALHAIEQEQRILQADILADYPEILQHNLKPVVQNDPTAG